MNRVELTGRLTKDVEIRYSADNKTAIATFTVAVDRRYTDGTDFIDCKAFSKTAEFMDKYFRKGMKAEVVGRIQKDTYKNKEGRTESRTYVIAEDVDFGESKSARSEESSNDKYDSFEGFTNIPDGEDDMLPFASPTR